MITKSITLNFKNIMILLTVFTISAVSCQLSVVSCRLSIVHAKIALSFPAVVAHFSLVSPQVSFQN